MSHNVVIGCLLVGLCSFYWLAVTVIATGHRSVQRVLRLVTLWLSAVIVLGLYIPGFLQYGLSPLSVVTFCLFLGTFVLLGLIQTSVRIPLLDKPSWVVLFMGVLSTVLTALTVKDIYALEVLKRHQTAPITGDQVLMWPFILLMLFYIPRNRKSQRPGGNL
ncbi:hypothetical protein C7B82_12740 [Stenomitos frigidus ULC18]|uniref:Uncharacterized protein n=1 Tax=Stenomitos frigidus ULC18 TaxID=2107698 RepID=A0A2T1E7Q4_9CYAN|nr:hypothetical protein C7B82_12740 [Stenomitos frigidus ULC18]